MQTTFQKLNSKIARLDREIRERSLAGQTSYSIQPLWIELRDAYNARNRVSA